VPVLPVDTSTWMLGSLARVLVVAFGAILPSIVSMTSSDNGRFRWGYLIESNVDSGSSRSDLEFSGKKV